MAGLDFNSATESVDVGDAPVDDMFVGGGTIMCRFNANSFGFGTNFGRLLDKASTTGAALGWSFQLDVPRFWPVLQLLLSSLCTSQESPL